MKTLIFIISLICLVPTVIKGQVNYLITDSIYLSGVKLIDGGSLLNSKYCQVQKGDKIIKYSPYEVTEYGFKDGRVYLSKVIQVTDTSQRYFLQCLYKGRTSLYLLKTKEIKTYFVENDSIFLNEIPRKNNSDITFHQLLSELTADCPKVATSAQVVNYNTKSLTRLISIYDECENKVKPFPFISYGVNLGYESTKLIVSSNHEIQSLNFFDFNYDRGSAISIFIDMPILASNFSFNTALSFSRHGFSYNSVVDNNEYDFIANISSLKIPVLLKYSYPSDKIRPFINIGGLAVYNFKNENSLYEAENSGIIVINELNSSSLIGEYNTGYSYGGGIEFKVHLKKSLLFEVRRSYYFNLMDSDIFKLSDLVFLTGISLKL